jgi:hypothetical protein
VNAIGPRRSVADDGVTVTTWSSFSTRTPYGADLNGSLRGQRLSGFGAMSAFRMVVDAGNVAARRASVRHRPTPPSPTRRPRADRRARYPSS